MTKATVYHEWQKDAVGVPPFTRSSPNLTLLTRWLTGNHGGIGLGIYAVKSQQDSSVISSHAFGAATDWRYDTPGPGRQYATVITEMLIDYSKELGIQLITDYQGCRIWRADRGWQFREANGSKAMGAAWATWLHIETTPQAWGNTTPIEQRLATYSNVFLPGEGSYSHWPHTPKKGIQLGYTGEAVKYLQAVLSRNGYIVLKVDGQFGPKTLDCVRAFQADNGLFPDGVVGIKTWACVDHLASIR